MIAPILNVADVDASIEFFTSKLGFEKSMALEGPDGRTAFAFVNMGEAVSVGLSLGEDIGADGVQFMIYIPEDKSIDDYYESVKANGVAIEAELKTEYWGDRVFSVREPNGYYLSLCKQVEETDMEKVAAVMRGEAERN